MQRTKFSWVALAIAAVIGCSGSDPSTRPYLPSAGAGPAGSGGAAAQSGSAGSAGTIDNPNNSGAGGIAGVSSTPIEECVNLQCAQARCSGGAMTTISGKVFDPAGRNPLYNVAVYVPNEPVLPLPDGAACDDCSALYTGHPIATALTDATGSFVLQNAPGGANIPLVIQIGKWRRQYVVPMVNDCQDNPMEEGLLRMPRNRSEGDIPKIAISTGSADTLECLLRRIGVDASEYVPGGGDGRVQIFKGSDRTNGGGGFFGGGGGGDMIAPNTSPAGPMSTAALWNNLDALMAYDIVLLSCEGQETLGMNQQALHDYANAGGRVFASHYHYSWFNTGPFGPGNLAIWRRGRNAPDAPQDANDDLGEVNGTIITELPNGDPFPKGQALLDWLTGVGALQNGTLRIEDSRFNAIVDQTHTPSQSWITAPGDEGLTATQYFSFNTPIGGTMNPDGPPYCGRVVFSDLHVGAASGDDPMQPVPTGCSDGELSPQEAALEFMLFDLSSCVTPDDVPPKPPVVE
jgi:hypothetical protein